jgi:UDP-3-O-[3-hydroxymyristoyl] N-acetylglucosamine deacetylase
MQHTLRSEIICKDVGLHTGEQITMRLLPAAEGHGIVFKRVDLGGNNNIPALWDNVTDTQLCTVISNESGAHVGTIEHIMAALRGCGIDNVLIEIDGSEVPIMDGSSTEFVQMIDGVGLKSQSLPRRGIRILKTVSIKQDDKTASLSPSDTCDFDGTIRFAHDSIGTQRYSTQLVNGNFRHDLAEARTFGFLQEVEWMRANGLAKGGSLDNAVVLDDGAVMNPDGLRFDDEFIRHKLLDAVGDLYLAGGPILGAYESYKAGHALNNQLLHALFSDATAWEYVELDKNYQPLVGASEPLLSVKKAVSA